MSETILPRVTAVLDGLGARYGLIGWDAEQLLAATDRRALTAQVEARLVRLPPQARDQWTRIVQGR